MHIYQLINIERTSFKGWNFTCVFLGFKRTRNKERERERMIWLHHPYGFHEHDMNYNLLIIKLKEHLRRLHGFNQGELPEALRSTPDQETLGDKIRNGWSPKPPWRKDGTKRPCCFVISSQLRKHHATCHIHQLDSCNKCNTWSGSWSITAPQRQMKRDARKQRE